jgi:multiple sugar transport system ATP-binding protein
MSVLIDKSTRLLVQGLTGKELIFGLRPEHITEPRRGAVEGISEFSPTLDVVEPMGMETLVYFTVNGAEICGRVNPNAGAVALQPMKLRADLSNMHLIDDGTGKVL